MLMDRKSEIYMKNLEKEGKLPKEYLDLKSKPYDDDDHYHICSLFEMEDEIKAPLYEWKNIKHDLESYYLSGSCHSYAPTFELTLARIVEPNEKWLVRTSAKHSTVINDKGTKVFDLLYWCYFADIHQYMFGDKPKNKDCTLGGKNAYVDASGKSSLNLISFDDFDKIMTANRHAKIMILDDPPIACYPDNVIVVLKVNKHKKYLVEIQYDKLTGEISSPIN